MTDRNLLNPTTHFIWFQNYTELLHDSYFWNAVENTLGIWVLSTVPQLLLALGLAHLLNTGLRGRTGSGWASCSRRSRRSSPSH